MDSNTLTAIAAWAAVACALLVVWLQNRATKRLTCLQLFMQLAAQYDSPDMQRARAHLAEQLLSNPHRLDINDTLLVFYENIAILHRRKLLDPELMWNTFTYDVRSYWYALEPYIFSIRKTHGDNSLFREFQLLNDYFVGDEAAKIKSLSMDPNRSSRDPNLSWDAVCEVLRWETRRVE